MKLALVLPNWVGDAVMATPALRALRTEFRQAETVGVMSPVIADTLRGLDVCDRTLLHEPRGKSLAHRSAAVLSQLRGERCDVAVLFPNSWRSVWLAWRAGIPRRVGFQRDFRGVLLTDVLAPKPRKVPHPVMDEYLRLAEYLECSQLPTTTELAVTDDDQAALDQFWSRQSTELRLRGVIALNTGGAYGPAKNWPREYFARLARKIVDELQHTVLVVCGPAERENSRVIVREAGRAEAVSLADEPLSIGLTKAAVRESRLLVTTDSGPRHFAQPFRVPVITLFGPTHPAWSDTHYDLAVPLQVDVPCGPCQQRECRLEHQRCLRDLTVERVFANVKRCLSTSAVRRVA